MRRLWRRGLVLALSPLAVAACSQPSKPSSGNAAAPVAAAAPAPPAPIAAKVVAVATGDTVHTEVPVQPDGGTFTVPVAINGVVSLNFTIDSGASDVVIPADVAGTLVRSGTLTRDDLMGNKTFVMANGEQVPSSEFRIHTLKVGTLILHDVVGTVGDARGALLLGQSFLSRLASWSFDNSRQVLVLKASGLGVEAGAAPPAALSPPAVPSQTASLGGADGTSTSLTPDSAVGRAAAYLSAWSSSDDAVGDAIRPFYAPVVRFYGSDISIEQLMAQKHAFAARWPSRSYLPRLNSLSSQCQDEHVCQVTGVLDWQAADAASGRRSTGVANFAMTFRDGLIVGEMGSVLSRQ
jgi:clan AA aspartic protease (TIGR02281 family)